VAPDHHALFPARPNRGTLETKLSLAEAENSATAAADDDLAALIAQLDRQIAKHQWDQPPGDNALETYRRLTKEFPASSAAAQIGERLSTVMWSEANAAEKAQRWDDAVHFYAMLKTLPPVPTAAILTTNDRLSAHAPENLVTDSLEPTTGSATKLAPSAPPVSRSNPIAPGATTSTASSPAATATRESKERSREIASLAMARGESASAHGDVISARRFYEVAASNDLAQAATAVGRTYDPIFLREKGVRGLLADAEAAKRWYQKAIDGGDVEARARLNKLLGPDKSKLAGR
jgi:hypothetical protein